jgi:hypothetical protein
MALQPFRFVHATNLRLDHPLWGLTGVSGETRRIAEDATLQAFEHIIQACLEHQPACLLLTGNCFDAAHPFRARIALENACETLAAQNIAVFIVPGQTDPPQAWQRGLQLPENVTLFSSRQPDPTELVVDGQTVATVEVFEDRARQAQRGSGGPFRIGLVAAGQHGSLQERLAHAGEGPLPEAVTDEFPALAGFRYLALGNGSSRLSVDLPRGVAHDPGCPQPLDGRQTHQLGCSLVDVDRAGRIQIRLLPTAVVRREEIGLTLRDDATWDQLVHDMQAALAEREPLATERLWLVRWVLEGGGELIDSLSEESSRRELCELLEQELAEKHGIHRLHEVELRANPLLRLHENEIGTIGEEFATQVDEHLSEHVHQFRRRLPTMDWPESGWVRYILDAADQLHPPHVEARARELGDRWIMPDSTKRR